MTALGKEVSVGIPTNASGWIILNTLYKEGDCVYQNLRSENPKNADAAKQVNMHDIKS